MNREQEILAAAERLFFERSFDGVGVDDIGRAVGLSGSALYRHFSSKDELLATLFDQVIDRLLTTLGTPNPDPHAELKHLIESFLDFTTQHERLAAIWVREERSMSDTYSRQYRRRWHGFMERWIACLERCYPERTAEELVTAARAAQLLILSDALRPSGGRRVADAGPLLAKMALSRLSVLVQDPVAAT